jgi:hypothetical protein
VCIWFRVSGFGFQTRPPGVRFRVSGKTEPPVLKPEH